MFGDDEDTLREILQDFVVPARNIVCEIEEAYEAKPAAGVGAAAHKLKSSSRAVGANALADLCAELEAAGNRILGTVYSFSCKGGVARLVENWRIGVSS